MVLIFGGAYMGKQTYARERLGVTEIARCAPAPVYDTGCAAGLEQFSLDCARRGVDAAQALLAQKEQWKDCVLIAGDLSCGVVPLDPLERAWREENGKMLRMLAEQAERVIRIWYGIAQVIK